MKWIETFKDYAQEQGIAFDFVFVSTNQINSGFGKVEFGKIKVVFPNLKKPRVFSEITSVLNSGRGRREKFFYLYYRRDKRNVDGRVLAEKLSRLASEEVSQM